MKVRIELSESEIQEAIKRAIVDKVGAQVKFYAHNVKFEGSVRFKKKMVRRPVVRVRAFIDTDV